ncbi:MAG: hypothetical protein MJZ40_03525 [Bacteroidaceae bacterium]|nr:hypothetical protein [Bacteroidaceae bacterium]
MTIDNASFSAHVTSEAIWAKAVVGIKSLTLNDCELVSPANCHLREGDGYLWYFDESGNEDLWFGDVIVRPKNEDDITTSIVSTTTVTQKHALYDLQGRSTSSDRVRGLYIVGGKKVLR